MNETGDMKSDAEWASAAIKRTGRYLDGAAGAINILLGREDDPLSVDELMDLPEHEIRKLNVCWQNEFPPGRSDTDPIPLNTAVLRGERLSDWLIRNIGGPR